jgi:hypothetical protein
MLKNLNGYPVTSINIDSIFINKETFAKAATKTTSL